MLTKLLRSIRSLRRKRGYKGVSAFAGTHKRFPVRRFLQQFPDDIKKPAIAILPGTFGWSGRLVEEFCAKFADRPHLVEIHVSNGPGRRSGKYKFNFAHKWDVNEFNRVLENRDPRVLAKIDQRIKRIRHVYEPHFNANTHVVVCPELEDNLTDKAFRVFAKRIRKNWRVEIVRNPCTKGRRGGKYTEHHGVEMRQWPRSIYNLDGVSVYVGDGEKYFKQVSTKIAKRYLKAHRRAFCVFLWLANQQGLGDATGWHGAGALPPRERTFIISDKAISEVKKLLKEA